MKWNKISEENLPEDGDTCFVYMPIGNSGYVGVNTYDWREEEKWLWDYTHWMPMRFPKPPNSN